MAGLKKISCLLVLGVFTASDAGALRPYAARHQQAGPYAARHKAAAHHAAPVKLATPVAPPPATPKIEEPVVPVDPVVAVPEAEVPAIVADAASQSLPSGSGDVQSYAAVTQLRGDLAEVKQMHGNVITLEKTLQADVTLLRESANLQKVSKSARARKAAKEQLRQAKEMVRSTEAMVRQSRKYSVESAKAALSEAQAVRKAADALSAEASAQLKLLAKRQAAQDLNLNDQNAAAAALAQTSPKAARSHVIRLTQIQNSDDTDDDSDDDDKDDA